MRAGRTMAERREFTTLRLDSVGKRFGTFNALRDLSLEIKRGEFIALLGPSGCGKSTALNCIAGLTATTEGAIWLDDTRIDTLSPERRGFGMVFQNYALFPHMTASENVGFGLKMRGLSRAQAEPRIAKALATVRLESQARKLPAQLSGGQQQRVAIARAIVIEPPVVLMDEPLSNLDAKLRLEMRQEIRSIHSGLGAVTIYVTHDQDEALSLADRIVVLRDGEIRQVGTPQDLYARPSRVDVAEFMGFRNRLNGKLVSRDGGNACVDLDGSHINGVAIGDVRGPNVIVAIRPNDLVAGASDGMRGLVEAIEYRGSDYFGQARTGGGAEVFFRASHKHQPGEAVVLAASPDKVLVYAAEQSTGAAP